MRRITCIAASGRQGRGHCVFRMLGGGGERGVLTDRVVVWQASLEAGHGNVVSGAGIRMPAFPVENGAAQGASIRASGEVYVPQLGCSSGGTFLYTARRASRRSASFTPVRSVAVVRQLAPERHVAVLAGAMLAPDNCAVSAELLAPGCRHVCAPPRTCSSRLRERRPPRDASGWSRAEVVGGVGGRPRVTCPEPIRHSRAWSEPARSTDSRCWWTRRRTGPARSKDSSGARAR